MSDDWERQTVLRKKTSLKERAVASGDIEMRKKTTTGNKQHAGPSKSLTKLEQDTETFKVDTVDKSISKAIIDGRQVLGLNQEQFATKLNEKVQVVREYEQGKAVPNQQILAKMERALGVKLRGSGIGQQLPTRASKT